MRKTGQKKSTSLSESNIVYNRNQFAPAITGSLIIYAIQEGLPALP
jgi:hypothetical protein